MKNKETYSVAKSLLEKYGETVTPDVRPSASPPENANKGMLRKRGRYMNFKKINFAFFYCL